MYDARKGGAASENEAKPWAFGLVALMVVVVVFFGVWKGPDLLNGGSGDASAAMTGERAIIARVFPEPREQGIILKMAQLDPIGYADFAQGFERGDSPDQIRADYTVWTERFTIENLHLLAVMDVKYLNQLIDLTVDKLRDLEASGSRYCSMSFYTALEQRGEAAAMTEASRIAAMAQTPGNPLYEYAVRANEIVLEGMIEARSNPKEYGELDKSDMSRIRDSAMSLMMAPEFQMMMSGREPTPAQLSKINACAVGREFIVAFDGINDRTKGRLWQTALRQGGDLSSLAAMR